MEIIGLTVLIIIIIGLIYILKPVIERWIVALAYSIIITLVTMSATALLTENKYYKDGAKEYLQHPERFSIKVLYEDSIPIDTIVELK